MDVWVHTNLTYLRANVATHMQGQRATALFTSPVISFYNKNPLTFIGEQKNGTETPPRYAKHLVWALHHSRAHAVLLIALLMIIILLSRCPPCLMLHAHDNWVHQLGLDAAPPRSCAFFFFAFFFQANAKTCEGLSILAFSVNSSSTHVSVRLVHALA